MKLVVPSTLNTFHTSTFNSSSVHRTYIIETPHVDFKLYGYSGTEAEAYCGMISFLNFQSLGSVTTENKNPTITPTTPPELPTGPSSTTTSTPTETPSTSGDLENIPAWALTYVNFVKENIMPDISNQNFEISATRGTIAQSLYNMCGNGENVTASHTFTDVGSYGIPIAWCHANSVMGGNSATVFGTEENVTREQFALILQKASEALGKTTANADEIVLSAFTDEGDVTSWARGGMAWAVANGLMSGNNNKLNPKGNITRTEVAVMLYNFDKL